MTVLDNAGQVARAVESVLNQGYDDIELLCVCGAGADGARRVCERFAERDIRVEVRGDVEGGLAQARNAALETARGRYIVFCGDDGWFAPDALDALVRAAKAGEGADLALGGVFVDTYHGRDRERRSTVVSPERDGLYPAGAFHGIAGDLVGSDLLCSLWGKLFDRGRIEALGLRFEGAPRSEAPFVLSYMCDAQGVAFASAPLYHHNSAKGTASALPYQPDLFDRCTAEYDALLGLWEHWGLEGDEAGLDAIHRRYIDQVVSCIESVCSKACPLSPIEKRDRIRDIVGAVSTRRAAERSVWGSVIARPLVDPIRKGNADVCYMEGRLLNLLGCTSKVPPLVGMRN